MTFDAGDDEALARVRAAKTPGWRHGTRKRPDKQKSKKVAKVKAKRAVERNRKMRDYATKRVEQGCWTEVPNKRRRGKANR